MTGSPHRSGGSCTLCIKKYWHLFPVSVNIGRHNLIGPQSAAQDFANEQSIAILPTWGSNLVYIQAIKEKVLLRFVFMIHERS